MNRDTQVSSSPRKGLQIDDYVKWIRLQLGGTVVKLEVEDQLPEIVEMAFNEIKNAITDIDMLTLPFSSIIDLSKYNVATVHYVMRGAANADTMTQLQDSMYLYINQTNWSLQSDYVDRIANAMLIHQNKSILATDLDFYHDKRENKLYIYCQQMTPNSVTLAYTRELTAVSDIYEPFWQEKLRRLALALTKEILGRIRSKYTPTNSTFQLDGDTLLNEAHQELSDIRTFLDTNSDMLFPLD